MGIAWVSTSTVAVVGYDAIAVPVIGASSGLQSKRSIGLIPARAHASAHSSIRMRGLAGCKRVRRAMTIYGKSSITLIVATDYVRLDVRARESRVIGLQSADCDGVRYALQV